MTGETIFEAVVMAALAISLLYMCRPFTYEAGVTEWRREWSAGNKDAHLVKRWYGWVVVHRRK